ncbi:MAG: hypothetical protein LUG98_03890 [Tannerellaceae bacterium]|nr:hypothetical protein [Tannerellaceae bacterium]
MYTLDFDITIGSHKLRSLSSVVIKCSVGNLANTAQITLPGMLHNKTLEVEDKIAVGDLVVIKLGYNAHINELPTEFSGYVESITTDENNIKINCVDEFCKFEKHIEDKIFMEVSVEELLKQTVTQIGNYTIKCNYDFCYDQFSIHNLSGAGLLLKIQQDTRANIWFHGNELHVHPHFTESGPKVIYDFAVNVEKADMSNNKQEKEKIFVIVEGNDDRGTTVTVTKGEQGGREINVRMEGVYQIPTLAARAEEELRIQESAECEGNLTGWLVPYVEPGYLAGIRDEDYPARNGTYYVIAVETSFSERGGVRKISFGKKLETN